MTIVLRCSSSIAPPPSSLLPPPSVYSKDYYCWVGAAKERRKPKETKQRQKVCAHLNKRAIAYQHNTHVIVIATAGSVSHHDRPTDRPSMMMMMMWSSQVAVVVVVGVFYFLFVPLFRRRRRHRQLLRRRKKSKLRCCCCCCSMLWMCV